MEVNRVDIIDVKYDPVQDSMQNCSCQLQFVQRLLFEEKQKAHEGKMPDLDDRNVRLMYTQLPSSCEGSSTR